MDTYSSQLQLVPKRHSQKSVYPAPHVVRKTRQTREETKDKGVVFVLVLSILSLITVTCIAAFYINHIQEHVRRLEQRIELLEQRPGAKSSECRDGERDKRELMEEDVELRAKRGVYEQEESEHRRMYHHGIASHNIALVFGNGENIDVNKTHVRPEHVFKIDPRKESCEGTLYARKDGQKFCTIRSTQPSSKHPKYQTSATSQLFNYFEKAAWMQDRRSSDYYELSSDGKVKVKRSGIYIIHANVHFVEVTLGDTPEYAVYKKWKENGDWLHKVISKCVVTPLAADTAMADAGVYPCSAWQLFHLNQGEEVYISIGSYAWFRVEKETFHLALIKLNEEDL